MSWNENLKTDINETFESLLFVEEAAQDSGYGIGYQVGRTRAIDGYHLGYHRASSLAAQLGYYTGLLERYLAEERSEVPSEEPSEEPPLKGKRYDAIAEQVLREIRHFPKENDESIDMMKKLEEIKSKYAKFCSLAKLSSSYPEEEKLEF